MWAPLFAPISLADWPRSQLIHHQQPTIREPADLRRDDVVFGLIREYRSTGSDDFLCDRCSALELAQRTQSGLMTILRPIFRFAEFTLGWVPPVVLDRRDAPPVAFGLGDQHPFGASDERRG